MSGLDNESPLRTIGRWGLMLLALLVLFILSVAPLEIAHLGEIRPAFMLMAIYYWTILRPGAMPPLLVFFIGLALDMLTSFPLGMHALVFVAVQWLAHRQRKFLLGQSFMVIWAGFALVAVGTGALQWALFSLLSMTIYTVKSTAISVLISALVFPVVVYPLGLIHRAMTDDPSAKV